MKNTIRVTAIAIFMFYLAPSDVSGEMQRVKYNHPGLVVDLGVGLWAWPLPMDYDGDGDFDLVVSCSDVPSNGLYFFENATGNVKLPVFKPARRIASGLRNVQISYLDGKPRVLTPGTEYPDAAAARFTKSVKLPVSTPIHPNRIRADQWKYGDYDGDGLLDLLVGVGDWTDYGGVHPDITYNEKGQWLRGPLRGLVYLLRNSGDAQQPRYEPPLKIEAAGKPIDVYGMPSPNLADFDGDGDLDILCGEFVDKFTYFENVGTRTRPRYAEGRYLQHEGQPLRVDLCMHVPVAIDWDRDGDMDLVVGQEDGRVMLVEHTGRVEDGLPLFALPAFFQQEADAVKFGALVTPVSVDWDGDGDSDLICGNTAGYIGFIENLDGATRPKWAAPKYLQADGKVIRIEAGPNGSIQGPCETRWGYTTLSVADWDHDNLPDLVVNSIWGKVVWYRNMGTRQQPRLAAAESIRVAWPPGTRPAKPAWNWWDPQDDELVTQWRTTPAVVDFNADGSSDLVMLDHEGYLALFERADKQQGGKVLPGKRIFVDPQGQPLRLNDRKFGGSGRRKLCLVDWDLDGRLDVLVNSRSIDLLRNAGRRNGRIVLDNQGPLDAQRLAGHTTSPTVCDWDRNGVPDLLVGAEDGLLYYRQNPHGKTQSAAGPGRKRGVR